MCPDGEGGAMKTLRLHLPVLDHDDGAAFLDLVTRIPGVVAAMVDPPRAALEVVVASKACALLVERQVVEALCVGGIVA